MNKQCRLFYIIGVLLSVVRNFKTLIVVGIIFSTSTVFSMEIKPLSDEGKLAVINDFRQVEASAKYVDVLKGTNKTKLLKNFSQETNASQRINNSQSDSNGGLFFEKGKYKAYIKYVKDRNFPKKYGGSQNFSENRSNVFNDLWTEIIAAHYLGSEHQKYEPTVEAVTSVVSISVLFSTSEELRELLKDNRIIRAFHIGTPSTPAEEAH